VTQLKNKLRALVGGERLPSRSTSIRSFVAVGGGGGGQGIGRTSVRGGKKGSDEKPHSGDWREEFLGKKIVRDHKRNAYSAGLGYDEPLGE